MRAIIENSHGGPEALTISEVPAPVPRSHEVLIRVHAAGINRADALQRRGFYPPPAGASAIYGLEVAGVIEAVGEGASVENRGTPVMALLAGGGYADYVTVPVDHVLPVPEQLSFAEAAGIPEVAATVYSNRRSDSQRSGAMHFHRYCRPYHADCERIVTHPLTMLPVTQNGVCKEPRSSIRGTGLFALHTWSRS